MHPGKTLSDCVLSSAQLDGSLGRPNMQAKHFVRDGVALCAGMSQRSLVDQKHKGFHTCWKLYGNCMRTSIKNHPRANEAMVAEDLSQSRQEDALEAGKSRQKVEGYSDNHKVRWYQTSA